MRLEVLCLGETLNPYSTKARGAVCDLVLACLDMCPSKARLEQTFDVVIDHDEKAAYAGKSAEHRLTVELKKHDWFSGRLRFKGAVVAVDGKPVNGKA